MEAPHFWAANARFVDESDAELLSGIDNPSISLITAGTSLYRAGHRFYFDKAEKTFHPTRQDSVFASPWWATCDDFNRVTWAAACDPHEQAESARAAFAVHPGWGGDCSMFASIVTTVDLTVWFGLGKSVIAPELFSGQLSIAFASEEILQIYIPGFREHAPQWSDRRQVISMGDTWGNGIGHQGNLPHDINNAERS